MNEKECVSCKTLKPLEDYSKSKKEKDGLKRYCKNCASEMNKRYREKHRKVINERNKVWYEKTREQKNQRTREALKKKKKTCSYCKELKPINDFYKRGNGGFYGECKSCHKIKVDKYTAANREKVLSRKKKYYKENRDYHLAYFKTYSIENSKRNVERARRWNINNPERSKELFRLAFHRRKARMDELESSFTRLQWKDCKEYFKNTSGHIECAYCSKEMKNATQDHFIAVSKGGSYTVNNILPVCLNCNSSKGNADFLEWYSTRDYFSQERVDKIHSYFRSL